MTDIKTPLSAAGMLGRLIVDSEDTHIASADSKKTAAHIVKCVNLHDELVEALLDAKYALYGNGPCNPKIEKTLEKAGAL